MHVDRAVLLLLVVGSTSIVDARPLPVAEPAKLNPSASEDWEAQGQEILALVREHFYRPEQGKVWADANAHYADGTKSADEFAERTRKALARLKTSHTNFYAVDQPERFGLQSVFAASLKPGAVPMPSIGLDLDPDRFVRHVFAGGPAALAGLKRGDRILAANGKPYHPIRSLQEAGHSPIQLSVQRRANEAPLEFKVVPRTIIPKDEWLEAQEKGARVIAAHGKKIAYMHLFSGAGPEHQDLLREAIAGPFAEADALVLDFRDGWGGCNPDFVNIFSKTPPVLEQLDRNGKAFRYDTQWRKKLVLLVNGGSRSGKEVVARTIQKHKLGTLVGQRTAGAVVAGRPFLLKGGGILLLAGTDVRVDGERLEGVGVTPEIELADVLPFANGVDPQLDRAIEEASK